MCTEKVVEYKLPKQDIDTNQVWCHTLEKLTILKFTPFWAESNQGPLHYKGSLLLATMTVKSQILTISGGQVMDEEG